MLLSWGVFRGVKPILNQSIYDNKYTSGYPKSLPYQKALNPKLRDEPLPHAPVHIFAPIHFLHHRPPSRKNVKDDVA